MKGFKTMLFREKIQEELLKIATFWIPNKELRHKIRDNAMTRFISSPLPDYYGNRKIYQGEEESDIIYKKLCENKPILICRYGSNELFTMRNYFLDKGLYFSKSLKKAMCDCAGFYPATNKNMIKFAKMQHELRNEIDILGIQNRLFEKEYCLKYLPKNTIFAQLDELCGICHKNSWTTYLKGKKVLVIHPFVESIKKQYEEKRELLFKNSDFLPEFELITYKAIQSIGDEKQDLPYKDWFEALEKMKKDIAKIDFDIALIGAGAYGIFLAHHCKMLGKQAVHLGGTTQLLFGITGGRWDSQPQMLKYANLENWIRPNKNEQPKGFKQVEGGCYW